MVATESGNRKGKNFFVVREKSGNFTSSQGKFKSWKEVREKGNFEYIFILFPVLFIVL